MRFFKKTFNPYHYIFFITCYLILQVAFSSGVSIQKELKIERGIHAVENRISLDLAHLSLPNPSMNVAGNPSEIRDYLDKLNTVIANQSLPLKVSSLQQVTIADDIPIADETIRQLTAPEQTISLGFLVEKTTLWSQLSGYPLLITAVLLFFIRPYLKRRLAADTSHALVDTPIKTNLKLDLVQKTISIDGKNLCVELANKPLCFYLALLSYCTKNPEARLGQHMLLPPEFLQLADKYFSRLVDLGHTVRKRPDFNSNIEKTLSEIRFALDEIFKGNPEHKSVYCPPKASGEGSRSKMHNFALNRLQHAAWEITGK